MLELREVRELNAIKLSISQTVVQRVVGFADASLPTAFAEFVAHQVSIHAKAQEMMEENVRLKVNQELFRHALYLDEL